MNTEYKTNGLELAAFLLTQNIKLINIDKSDRRKVYFCFEDMNKCEKLSFEFISGAVVDARKLLENIQALKNIIFNYE